MVEPWNDACLLPPPVHTFLSNRKVDISEIRSTCRNIIKVLSNQSPLHKESAILSRFAYKFDKKFRSDIGYRHYKKVNVALRRYLALNLLKDVENFSDTLPSADDEAYLPTRQMLEYVLIRLITFSKVMLRICICSKQACIFYLDRIKCGESHWMSLMPYAVLSRVWSLCTVLLRHVCGWYARLHPWLLKLQLKGVEFLPNNYTLPSDLEEWLDLNNIDSFGRFEWASYKCLSLHQTLIAEDDDNPDSLIDYVNRLYEGDDSEELPYSNILEEKSLSEGQPMLNQVINVDKGEIITRDSFKPQYPQSKPTKLKKEDTYKHSPAHVTDRETLRQLILKEEDYRNEQSELSLTSHLSFMQWHALKNALDALADSLSNKRKIEKKFNKIWKEKCIDYS